MPIIRILGGIHKQKSLQVSHHDGLRPTAHRVRQTAFDVVLHRFYPDHIGQEQPWTGLRVLDICAGLGGYGFEALSRGADFVSFVEQSSVLAKQLISVACSWNTVDRVRVFNHAWPMPLAPGHTPYDVIFLDPPYGQEDTIMLAMINACKLWMVPNAVLVVESNSSIPEIDGFVCVLVRNMGQKSLSFLQLTLNEKIIEIDSDEANKVH